MQSEHQGTQTRFLEPAWGSFFFDIVLAFPALQYHRINIFVGGMAGGLNVLLTGGRLGSLAPASHFFNLHFSKSSCVSPKQQGPKTPRVAERREPSSESEVQAFRPRLPKQVPQVSPSAGTSVWRLRLQLYDVVIFRHATVA